MPPDGMATSADRFTGTRGRGRRRPVWMLRCASWCPLAGGRDRCRGDADHRRDRADRARPGRSARRRGDRVVLFDRAVPETVLARAACARRSAPRLPGDVQALGELMGAVREHRVEAIVDLAFVLGGGEPGARARDPGQHPRHRATPWRRRVSAGWPGCSWRARSRCTVPTTSTRPRPCPSGRTWPGTSAGRSPSTGAASSTPNISPRPTPSTTGWSWAGSGRASSTGAGRERGGSAFLNQVIDRPARGQAAAVGLGDARVSLVYVEDVADQYVSLLDADLAVFARRRFFNTGGDTATVRELAETVRRVVPEAQIAVTSTGALDLGGLASRVSDRSLEDEVGHRRRFTPLSRGPGPDRGHSRARRPAPVPRMMTRGPFDPQVGGSMRSRATSGE